MKSRKPTCINNIHQCVIFHEFEMLPSPNSSPVFLVCFSISFPFQIKYLRGFRDISPFHQLIEKNRWKQPPLSLHHTSLDDGPNPPSSISAIGSVPWQLHSLSRCSPDFMRYHTWGQFLDSKGPPQKKTSSNVES